ncbi:MAG TPA: DinB family protein [Bryobacteraceae bacterium]|nr:DinB family protein [Bryobacteraceae bacterium]
MITPPETTEYQSYYGRYISLVPGKDLVQTLDRQLTETLLILRSITEEKSLHRYAPGKWSIKEVLGHLIDAERIFTYRALRFARKDQTPLPGFDQDPYVEAANFDARPWTDLVDEFEHVRRSTILFFRSLRPEDLLRLGTASQNAITVRALGYIIAGHELHHMEILRDRYL